MHNSNYWLPYKDQTILALQRTVDFLKKNPHKFTNNTRAWPLRREEWEYHMNCNYPLFNFEAALWFGAMYPGDLKGLPTAHAEIMIWHLTMKCNNVAQEPNEWAKDKSVQDVIELLEFAMANYDECDKLYKFSERERKVHIELYGDDEEENGDE